MFTITSFKHVLPSFPLKSIKYSKSLREQNITKRIHKIKIQPIDPIEEPSTILQLKMMSAIG